MVILELCNADRLIYSLTTYERNWTTITIISALVPDAESDGENREHLKQCHCYIILSYSESQHLATFSMWFQPPGPSAANGPAAAASPAGAGLGERWSTSTANTTGLEPRCTEAQRPPAWRSSAEPRASQMPGGRRSLRGTPRAGLAHHHACTHTRCLPHGGWGKWKALDFYEKNANSLKYMMYPMMLSHYASKKINNSKEHIFQYWFIRYIITM